MAQALQETDLLDGSAEKALELGAGPSGHAERDLTVSRADLIDRIIHLENAASAG